MVKKRNGKKLWKGLKKYGKKAGKASWKGAKVVGRETKRVAKQIKVEAPKAYKTRAYAPKKKKRRKIVIRDPLQNGSYFEMPDFGM